MSFRRMAVVGIAAVLSALSLMLPAEAGTGSATACDDAPPPGATKIPVVNDPLLGHLTIEVRVGPPVTDVAICFSDRPSGTPSVIYGGFALVQVDHTNGNIVAVCVGDGALLSCNGTLANGTLAPGDLPTTRPNTVCAVYALGACRLFVDTVSVEVFGSPTTTTLTILGTNVVTDPGEICVGLAGCP